MDNPVNRRKKATIIERDKGVCYICGSIPVHPVIEHKVPARVGGKATEDNLAVACQSCNCKKRFVDARVYA